MVADKDIITGDMGRSSRHVYLVGVVSKHLLFQTIHIF
jgi:hypothetical protein